MAKKRKKRKKVSKKKRIKEKGALKKAIERISRSRRMMPVLVSLFLIAMSASALLLSGRVVVDLTTDKRSYSSVDDATFSVNVYTPQNMRDVFVRVHGIKNNQGQEFLYKQKVVDLVPGNNVVQFSYILPYLASCIGFLPGNYSVNAEVLINNDVVASDMDFIELA